MIVFGFIGKLVSFNFMVQGRIIALQLLYPIVGFLLISVFLLSACEKQPSDNVKKAEDTTALEHAQKTFRP